MCYPGASEVKNNVLKLECEGKIKKNIATTKDNTNLKSSKQPPKDSRNM